jgi:hypothetical protein
MGKRRVAQILQFPAPVNPVSVLVILFPVRDWYVQAEVYAGC